MININVLNQNNLYSLGKPDIPLSFSALKIAQTHTTTGNMGELIPIFIKEMQPNEKIRGKQEANIQFTPMITNLMHQVKGETITYFVPYRLIWEKFEEFITGGEDGTKLHPMPSTRIEAIILNMMTRDKEIIEKLEIIENRIEKELLEIESKLSKYLTNNITPDIENDMIEINTKYALQQLMWNFIRQTRLNPNKPTTYKDKKLGINIYKYDKPFEPVVARKLLKIVATEQELLETLRLGYNGYLEAILEQLSQSKKITKNKYGSYSNNYPHETGIVQDFESEVAYYNNLLGEAIKLTLTHTLYDYSGLPTSNAELGLMMLLSNTEIYKELNRTMIQGLKDAPLLYNILNSGYWKTEISTLLPRCYKKIYNDWIRLQDWEEEIEIKDDANWELKKGNYDWDYFTRARRFQIRGDMPTVPVDLSGAAVIEEDGYSIIDDNEKGSFNWQDAMTAAALLNYYTANAKIRPRYREHLLNRWGVKVQDTRLQLSEFISAQNISINANGIAQTAPGGTGQTKQGHITGQLWGNESGININYDAQEHGILLSMIIIKPANVYEQGIPQLLQKRNKFELPTPELANLPDVVIKATELNAGQKEDKVLGYKAIYDEYRTSWNIVTGIVRPTTVSNLSSYTLARKIGSTDMENICKCEPETERVKQYTNEPDFIMIMGTYYKDIIPLPYTSDTSITL